MAGTAISLVQRSRSMASSMASTEKPGTMTCVQPATRPRSKNDRPARWNSGATCSSRALSSTLAASSEICELMASAEWLSITPLGRPVVPPV